MFKAIKQLRAFLSATGISLPELWRFASRIAGLWPLPAFKDERALRQHLLLAAATAQDIAAETPIKTDDVVTGAIYKLIANDDAWELGYRLVSLVLVRDDGGDTLVGACADIEATAGQLSEALAMAGDDANSVAMIDPASLIAIITTVVNLLRWFRSRREG